MQLLVQLIISSIKFKKQNFNSHLNLILISDYKIQ